MFKFAFTSKLLFFFLIIDAKINKLRLYSANFDKNLLSIVKEFALICKI